MASLKKIFPGSSYMSKLCYCCSHISNSKLILIKNEYPAANGYGEIVNITDNYCGEALGTAIVLND